jgi:hypothetical protein
VIERVLKRNKNITIMLSISTMLAITSVNDNVEEFVPDQLEFGGQ